MSCRDTHDQGVDCSSKSGDRVTLPGYKTAYAILATAWPKHADVVVCWRDEFMFKVVSLLTEVNNEAITRMVDHKIAEAIKELKDEQSGSVH